MEQSPASADGARAERWGWDINTRQAVRWESRGPGHHVLGPYPSKVAAEAWRERRDQRDQHWEDEQELWESTWDDDDDDALDHQAHPGDRESGSSPALKTMAPLTARLASAGMSRPIQIAPSVLPADFARLGEEVAALEAAGVDLIQWDVMDGCFVPNLTFGPDVIAAARAHTTLPFEAHLMVVEPDAMAARYVDAGCSRLIVHAEACRHLHRTLAAITELGATAAVALNPATPASAVAHVLDLVDLVLVMTVNPGFGGQRYLDTMEPKIAEIAEMLDAAGRRNDVDIEVDGGIGPDTIGRAAGAGANVLVAGTALYRHPGGLQTAVSELRTTATAAAAANSAP